jgi:DNA/RNA-binding domain of Phe-tRNA-synthetase-like protein
MAAGRPVHRARLQPEVTARFPGYAAVVLYAYDVANGPSDDFSRGLLRAAERDQRRALGAGKAADHPHVAAWRDAYRSFGLKPGRYPSSVEALLSRTLRGEDLPEINRLVDIYNAVSVKHALPAGGEDLGQVASDPTLGLARGDEPFDTLRSGESVIDHPERGEVVWSDRAGVTCRAWNWRQCVRTRLTEATRHAYFILDRLDPYPLDALHAAGRELADLIRSASPGGTLEAALLDAQAPGGRELVL